VIDHFALLALVLAAANSSSAVSRLSVFVCRKSERFGLCQRLCFPPRTSRFLFSRPFVCAATGRWERGGTLEGDGLPQNSTSRFGDSLPLRARLAQSLPRSPIFFLSLPASPIRARECGCAVPCALLRAPPPTIFTTPSAGSRCEPEARPILFNETTDRIYHA
jgi:hypothetical protein